MEQGNDEDDANHYSSFKRLPPSSSSNYFSLFDKKTEWLNSRDFHRLGYKEGKRYVIVPPLSIKVLSATGTMTDRSQGKLMKRTEEDGRLPWDVLDIISKKLDFDDLFHLAGVCKNWRTFHKSYWRNFMASQAPLLIETSSYAKKAFIFISICDRKVYRSKMDYFWGLSYAGFSSGYVIMAGANNTLLLMNPFTRRKKEISTSTIQGNLEHIACHPLLAFVKGSEEFIIVVLCQSTYSLHIYQSRNSCWATYSRCGNPWKVVDFVVLHHTLYVITEKAEIGVVSLNSATLKFLQLNNTPNLTSVHLRLVSCDGKLLVVLFEPKVKLEVYKIDFSSMDWVRLETLGDLALFYAMRTKCFALSNPSRWGYNSNCLYYIDRVSAKCKVYSMKNKVLLKITPSRMRAPPRSRLYWLDWCSRNVRDEVDYSLVE